MNPFFRVLYFFIDTFSPSFCGCCGIPLSAKDRGLCASCRAMMEEVSGACPRCSYELHDGSCPFCTGREVYFDQNLALLEYRGTAREAFHSFKFGKKRGISRHLARIAVSRLAEIEIDAALVTYVPMAPRKLARRGFNQSELIARGIAAELGIPCRALLREKKNSAAQKELGYRARFINTLGRYGVIEKNGLSGKNLLLVDDIFTTGATINECSRVLKLAGAGRIFSLTVARAPIKRLEIV